MIVEKTKNWIPNHFKAKRGSGSNNGSGRENGRVSKNRIKSGNERRCCYGSRSKNEDKIENLKKLKAETEKKQKSSRWQ